MLAPGSNPAALYLPLLTDSQIAVRRQACAILFGTYGEQGLTMLRRFLAAPDGQLRQRARVALQHVAELTDLSVSTQPFQGIYIECLGRVRLFAWVHTRHNSVGWQKLLGVLGYLIHCGRRGTTQAAEDEVFVGHGVMYINDRIPRATVGGRLQVSADWELVPTLVCRGASIASGAVILCSVTIGAGALVGAGAVVTHDVPAGTVVAGVPAWLHQRNQHREE